MEAARQRHLARSGGAVSGEFACEQFACIEKYGGVRFEVWQLASMTERAEIAGGKTFEWAWK
jgi:hypothetical protein